MAQTLAFCTHALVIRGFRQFSLSGVSGSMKRRKPTKPPAARQTALLKTAPSLVDPRLISRRPVAVAIAVGVAVLLTGFVLRKSSRSSSSQKKMQAPIRGMTQSQKDRTLKSAAVLKAEVIAEYDHDHNAFTQGLLCHEGHLYESTGLNGKSSIREIDRETGKVLKMHRLRNEDFGEGLALLGSERSRLIQVIWKVGKGYVYDRATLRELFSVSFEGDAWGLASTSNDENNIFLSDGSSTIKVLRLEGKDLRKVREFTVRDGSREVGLLNELEVIGNELWANVWMSDFIARINPDTGAVNSWVDLRQVLREGAIPAGHSVDVLNGIAYDSIKDTIYVTGKHWPKLYAIKPTEERVAENISAVTNAFFLNPAQVSYIHTHVIA